MNKENFNYLEFWNNEKTTEEKAKEEEFLKEEEKAKEEEKPFSHYYQKENLIVDFKNNNLGQNSKLNEKYFKTRFLNSERIILRELKKKN